MKNIIRGSVALFSVLAGSVLVGSAFAPAQAKPQPAETVINLPEMVITGDASRPNDDMVIELDGGETVQKNGLLPFHPERCAALIRRFGEDADYRCPRSRRSAPTGGRKESVRRTFVHTLAQGGRPDAPTVVVHEYQDAE